MYVCLPLSFHIFVCGRALLKILAQVKSFKLTSPSSLLYHIHYSSDIRNPYSVEKGDTNGFFL